ncbi:TetR/AcrR family transcriptional regulator [Thermostaphylospora chromogena]|uniref:DNA-binding transcriptional regulator, AcrR family n=1 Tax=Thermostaphylospora chromogena TaxID=35622 RepID=A0A1H1HBU7_9ACTN|nr:TetR/AcrR family transcriptional regulator [Thermostaphylospora chromogena]SDR22853.1 DNA-binding transcriptional regulator, AcrR family [Thermostaphylospora chromogena]
MGDREEVRRRIIDAATRLLRDEGREAVTTRTVSAAAGVQVPTIYRLFTDMNGLLDAVAADGFTRYLERKHAQALSDDPVEDLRRGWDLHTGFGLENPAHYLLMYGRTTPGAPNPAAERSLERLRLLVERIAVAGLLSVSVETAVAMVHAAGVGLTLNLIGTPPDQRDPTLSERLREAVIAAITITAAPPTTPTLAQRAIALKAVLDRAADLYTPGEQALLRELLDRAAAHTPPVPENRQAD